MLYLKCKDFINDFKYPLNYEQLLLKLNEISVINCDQNNCDSCVTISFQEMPEFGVGARVKDGNIRFNKTRLETITNLNIDCTQDNHLKWFWQFYNSFNENDTVNSEYETCLYNFMKKYIELNAEIYFANCGSYKFIPYELLDCIFHENEHVFQKMYDQYLSGDEYYPTDTRGKVLVFTEAFDMIHYKLKKNNIPFEYQRNNYIFPIEFDARYQSMIMMNELKKQYFEKDELFSKYLVYSNLIPEDLNINLTAEEIFKTYEYFYNIYKNEIGSDYDNVTSFLIDNKDEIINEMKRRYTEMLNIVNKNKLEDDYGKSRISK